MPKNEKGYIAEFEAAHPVKDCLGCTDGRYKWRRVMDCIDLRYGHSTEAAAKWARRKAARAAYHHHVWLNETVSCPECGKPGKQGIIWKTGMCASCVDRYNINQERRVFNA